MHCGSKLNGVVLSKGKQSSTFSTTRKCDCSLGSLYVSVDPIVLYCALRAHVSKSSRCFMST